MVATVTPSSTSLHKSPSRRGVGHERVGSGRVGRPQELGGGRGPGTGRKEVPRPKSRLLDFRQVPPDKSLDFQSPFSSLSTSVSTVQGVGIPVLRSCAGRNEEVLWCPNSKRYKYLWNSRKSSSPLLCRWLWVDGGEVAVVCSAATIPFKCLWSCRTRKALSTQRG